MKKIVVAPVGDTMDALFIGIKEIETERVILISPQENRAVAEKTKARLAELSIPTQIIDISGNIWEAFFRKVSEIKSVEDEDKVIINSSTTSSTMRCAAISAAFVNGLKAFSIENEELMLLPILKFSYYKLLSDKKLKLLELLNEKDCCSSLEELSKRANMSLPLISYHVNGNLKSEGMKSLGLVETNEVKGRIEVSITILGRMLMKGYIDQKKTL